MAIAALPPGSDARPHGIPSPFHTGGYLSGESADPLRGHAQIRVHLQECRFWREEWVTGPRWYEGLALILVPYDDGDDMASLPFREPLGEPTTVEQLAAAFLARTPIEPESDELFDLPDDYA